MQVKQSKNILNWYPFNKNQDILEIGANVTSLFCDKCKSVTTVEPNLEKSSKIEKRDNLEIIPSTVTELNLNKQYDIITLIGWNKRTKEIKSHRLAGEHIVE